MGGFLKTLLISHRRRLIAVSLLILTLGLLYVAIVLPLLGLARQYSEAIDDLAFRLQRYQKIAAEKNIWLERLEQVKQQGEGNASFISRDTAALASADLQTMIKQTVTDAGGELISTQVIPDKQEEKFTRIAVKVRMNGTVEVLRDVLYALETEQPVLFVENLNLRSTRFQRNPVTRQYQASSKLNIDFDVIGYMRSGAG
jgi:general secretion pathway protein M